MDPTPSEKLFKFFSSSKPAYYRKGDIVLRTGDARSGAFFLKKGYVKDSCLSVDGREFTLFIFRPNDLFSYNWIFNQIPNEHSFRAVTDCIIYEKSREGLILFFDQNPDVQFLITQNIVRRLRGLTQRIEGIVFGSASRRVCSIFFILGERFGKLGEKGIVIPIPFTQRDIAELIGMSRETTSIEIKKISDSGIITRPGGHYVIAKPKILKRLAGVTI